MPSRERSAATTKLQSPCEVAPKPRGPHSVCKRMWCPRPEKITHVMSLARATFSGVKHRFERLHQAFRMSHCNVSLFQPTADVRALKPS